MNPKSAPFLGTIVVEPTKSETVIEVSPTLVVKKTKKSFACLWWKPKK
jgi:hypothetical protein